MTRCFMCSSTEFLALHKQATKKREYCIWLCIACHRQVHLRLANLTAKLEKEKSKPQKVWSVS